MKEPSGCGIPVKLFFEQSTKGSNLFPRQTHPVGQNTSSSFCVVWAHLTGENPINRDAQNDPCFHADRHVSNGESRIEVRTHDDVSIPTTMKLK